MGGRGGGRYSRSMSRSYSRSPPRRYSRSRSPRTPRSRSRSASPRGGGRTRGDGRRYRSPPRRGYRESPTRDNFRSRSPPPRGGGDRGGGGYRGGGPPESYEHQIYVARFARRTSENELRRAFDKYGQIDKIDLKEGRGFGFIYFRNRRDADEAIDEMNGRSLPHSDERLVVEKAGLKSRRTRDRESRRRSRSRGMGGPEVCYNCNREGHFARECRDRDTGRRGRDAETEKKISEGRCFICNEKGHKKMDCPERQNGGGGGGGFGGGGRGNGGPRRQDDHDRRGSRSPFSGSASKERGGGGAGQLGRPDVKRQQRSRSGSPPAAARSRSGSRGQQKKRGGGGFSDDGSKHSGRAGGGDGGGGGPAEGGGAPPDDEERKRSDVKREGGGERRSYSRSISPRGSRARDLRRDIGRITNNNGGASRSPSPQGGDGANYRRQRKQRSDGYDRSHSRGDRQGRDKDREAYHEDSSNRPRHAGNADMGNDDDTEAQTANMTNNAPSKLSGGGSKEMHQKHGSQVYKREDDYAADHRNREGAAAEEQS